MKIATIRLLRLFTAICAAAAICPVFSQPASESKTNAAGQAADKPVFTLQPRSAFRTPGDSVTFTASATARGEVNYRWRHIGTNIPGATNASYTIQHVLPDDYGQYVVTAYTKTGFRVSDFVSLNPWNRTGWGANAEEQLNGPEATTNIISISAGQRHALALSDDGTIVQWGHQWASIPARATNIIGISAGYTHSLALRKDGSVIAWGNSRNSANRSLVNRNLISVSAGQFHNLAVTAARRVVTWGTNNWGLLRVPSAATNVIAAAAGARHSLVLRADGTVLAWGDDSAGQMRVPPDLRDVVAIAAGGEHSLALRANGTIAAWGRNDAGQCAPPANVTNATAIAAGAAHSIALLADGRVVCWGDNSSGQTNTGSWTTNFNNVPVRLISAGGNFTLAQALSVTADYPVNVRTEALLIYNTNRIATNSAFIKDYYLTHRPRIDGINVLGVSCSTNEVGNKGEFEQNVVGAVREWMNVNRARHPLYIIMSYDLPTYFTSSVNGDPGASRLLAQSLPGVKPAIFYLNMGTVEATRAYIDKLEFFGTNNFSTSPIISASEQGYGNTNFIFDGVRTAGGYKPFFQVVSNAFAAVRASENDHLACDFRDALETNFICEFHLTGGTNVAGYMTWGADALMNPGYATNSAVKWHGNSGWWIIETVESFNGCNYGGELQGTFRKWFARNAFGGRNYSNTPVGAVGHVWEPTLGGINDSSTYFGLWARGKKFAVAASASQQPWMRYYIIFGDPFVRR